jgi:hypothetical protein
MGESQESSQENLDLHLGKLALERGLIDARQLRSALRAQAGGPESASSPPRPLGALLVELGFLTETQVLELLQVRQAPTFPPLGKYVLSRELGRGAAGVVYEAFDTELKRSVALKLLLTPAEADAGELGPVDQRFLREARLSGAVPPHPHLVRVLEVGVIEGKRYLAMELVRGLPMSRWRRQGSVTLRQHVSLLRDVALAVHHLHEHGVVHRDLKPDNVLVDAENRPHVSDFGLARDLRAARTTTGGGAGTPAYMSPEQIQGKKDLDRRADVYSLGVMLYETITGRLPFEGDTAFEVMTKALREPIVPPSRITKIQINPILYRNLENICLIALAKDPRDRYPDAQAFARDLALWLRGEDFKVIVPRSWRVWRARRWLKGAIAAAAAGLLAAGFLAFRQDPPQGPAFPAAAVAPQGLRPGAVAEYYAGINFNVLGLRRLDERGTFSDTSHPLWPEGPGWHVSLRWSGYLRVPETGLCEFQASASEGVRLSVDGRRLIDRWAWSPPATDSATCTLEAGFHEVVLEHFHTGAEETVSLAWKPKGASEVARLGPASFFHDPARFKPHPAEVRGQAMPTDPDLQEGEGLGVLSASEAKPVVKTYGFFKYFWEGRWSGDAHLWWGNPVRPGDKLRLQFKAPEAGLRTLVLSLTRSADHGIFRVAVNGMTVREALDLYDERLITSEIEFPAIPFKAGDNELEFTVVGTNPAAREWGPGGGLYKIGIDSLRIR